jgi:hypothetical protein
MHVEHASYDKKKPTNGPPMDYKVELSTDNSFPRFKATKALMDFLMNTFIGICDRTITTCTTFYDWFRKKESWLEGLEGGTWLQCFCQRQDGHHA